MKVVQRGLMALAVVSAVGVAQGGFFDALKNVANEAANVADGAAKITETVTKPTEDASGQIQTPTPLQVNAEESNHSVIERRGKQTMTSDEQSGAQKKQVNVTHAAQFKAKNVQRKDEKNEVSEVDRDFVAFVNQLGAKAAGPTNVLLGG